VTLIEILTFAGCPNADGAMALVERVITEAGIDADVRRVEVRDADVAAEQRFLGSPTVRVNGRDVEPGADERDEFVYACRVYRTPTGFRGQPEESWLRDALEPPHIG